MLAILGNSRPLFAFFSSEEQDSDYLKVVSAQRGFLARTRFSQSDGGCKNMPLVCGYMGYVIPISPFKVFGDPAGPFLWAPFKG